MGWIPPPGQISDKEFKKRINKGAQTMAEIDPNFTKWALSGPVGLFHRIFKTQYYLKFYKKLF